ncbi:hypothetical protein L486_01986 [Kwoniella mangroviensis CBS 10435]|uniref:Uncharacterized protein n=1 Tax=Kwoniella mangroviensis CBS 10435 TaxID=1331196 RepID=A0A1B9J3G5_9TREE|nr:hypothetical protein L486_01986 [Kwoniella mangroviensis CBS 10435]
MGKKYYCYVPFPESSHRHSTPYTSSYGYSTSYRTPTGRPYRNIEVEREPRRPEDRTYTRRSYTYPSRASSSYYPSPQGYSSHSQPYASGGNSYHSRPGDYSNSTYRGPPPTYQSQPSANPDGIRTYTASELRELNLNAPRNVWDRVPSGYGLSSYNEDRSRNEGNFIFRSQNSRREMSIPVTYNGERLSERL